MCCVLCCRQVSSSHLHYIQYNIPIQRIIFCLCGLFSEYYDRLQYRLAELEQEGKLEEAVAFVKQDIRNSHQESTLQESRNDRSDSEGPYIASAVSRGRIYPCPR